MAALDRQRRAAGLTIGAVCAAAAMRRETYHAALKPQAVVRARTLRKISGAIAVLRVPANSAPPNAIVALVRCAELMLSAELARSKKLARACAGGGRRLSAARLRRYAIYLVTVEMLIDNADVARALDCSRQNIKQARDAVDDWREHALVDALLDRLAAILKGSGG